MNAIVEVLAKHGPGLGALALRAKLPADERGEGFDFELCRLVNAKVVQMIAIEGSVIYQLAPKAPPAPEAPVPAIGGSSATGAAAAAAYYPPPPAQRVQLLERGVDEVPIPPPKNVSLAKPERDMPRKKAGDAGESNTDKVIELLAKRPLTTGEVAEELKISAGTASTLLKQLASAKAITKPEGGTQRSPWQLPGASAGPAAESRSPARATSKHKPNKVRKVSSRRKKAKGAGLADREQSPANGFVADLELKLRTLEDQAKACPSSIIAFVLREIHLDLQKLSA